MCKSKIPPGPPLTKGGKGLWGFLFLDLFPNQAKMTGRMPVPPRSYALFLFLLFLQGFEDLFRGHGEFIKVDSYGVIDSVYDRGRR
jgi:hypothetical protein